MTAGRCLSAVHCLPVYNNTRARRFTVYVCVCIRMRVRACDMRDARVYACYVYGAGVYICTYTCVRVCICALARMCVHACVFMGLYLARNPQLCDTSSRPDGGRTSSGGPTSKRPSPPSARRVRRGRRRDTPCARFRPHPTARSATDCDRRDAARALPFPPLPSLPAPGRAVRRPLSSIPPTLRAAPLAPPLSLRAQPPSRSPVPSLRAYRAFPSPSPSLPRGCGDPPL